MARDAAASATHVTRRLASAAHVTPRLCERLKDHVEREIGTRPKDVSAVKSLYGARSADKEPGAERRRVLCFER